jgi:hypothetical protein
LKQMPVIGISGYRADRRAFVTQLICPSSATKLSLAQALNLASSLGCRALRFAQLSLTAPQRQVESKKKSRVK